MSETRMLWRIFEPMKNEITGSWRTVHNEDPHSETCSTHGEMRNSYNILVENLKRRDNSED